jgi:hypothetical protein
LDADASDDESGDSSDDKDDKETVPPNPTTNTATSFPEDHDLVENIVDMSLSEPTDKEDAEMSEDNLLPNPGPNGDVHSPNEIRPSQPNRRRARECTPAPPDGLFETDNNFLSRLPETESDNPADEAPTTLLPSASTDLESLKKELAEYKRRCSSLVLKLRTERTKLGRLQPLVSRLNDLDNVAMDAPFKSRYKKRKTDNK